MSKINYNDSLGFYSVIDEQHARIVKTYSPERHTDKFDNHLFKGEKINGKIVARENNFGILLVRFAKLSDIVSDTIVFRIKKDGSGNWNYEHQYNANQFQDNQYFTFGFPSISDSKNKTYAFEIESITGSYKHGIGFNANEQNIALVYKFSKNDFKNPNTFLSFIYNKFVYAFDNINYFQNWGLIVIIIIPYILILYLRFKEITILDMIKYVGNIKGKKIDNRMKIRIVSMLTYINQRFVKTLFYRRFLNTDLKKRIAIGLIIFLTALTYRYGASLVNLDKLYYGGLGGQGDYDQFIRTATCAIRNFCSAILGQNFLFESSILGIFYNIFGFTGGLKAYLYLMITLSSIIATLPYVLLTRKGWFSLGGILGGFYLATNDFLTLVSLNFTPDNGSLFTFSMFYIVYFITLQKMSLRWLLFFGLIGIIDALNKALFIINDLVALALFVPVFFIEKIKFSKTKKISSLLLSVLPLLLFVLIYTAWETFVFIKFHALYFLGGLILTHGVNYVSYTSLQDSSLGGGIISNIFYFCVSAIIMLKNLIDYSGLNVFILTPIFVGMFYFMFIKKKFPKKKFMLFIILSFLLFIIFILVRNNYFKVQTIFNGYYLYAWTDEMYINTFLLIEIIFLFILNFSYTALKLTLPVLPYVIMLFILAKNSPWSRLHTQVVVWAIVFLAFLIDWIVMRFNKKLRMIPILVLAISFFTFYLIPKSVVLVGQIYAGSKANHKEVMYLRWVNDNSPTNAIILAGGKSDLVTTAKYIKRPIAYSTLYSTALLIKPNKIPGIGPSDFSIIIELKNKDNFKRNKYLILDDDVYIWRSRVAGVQDNLFSTTSAALINGQNYSIRVYKTNPTLKKGIFELNLLNQ